PRSPLFPYTTLFRSTSAAAARMLGTSAARRPTANASANREPSPVFRASAMDRSGDARRRILPRAAYADPAATSRPRLPATKNGRSEEHTSELQSREN